MKTLNNLRKRGFTLMETVLVIAVGLGLLIGGIVFYQQANASSTVTDKTRAAVGVSSEVLSQYRTQASFGTEDITTSVKNASSIPDGVWNHVGTVTGAGQSFTLTLPNLDSRVCQRIADSGAQLGANATATCNAAAGTGNPVAGSTNMVTVTYTR